MDYDRVAAMGRPTGLPFRINKIGHVVLHVSDIERSTQFYTEVLGFKISDIYAHNELPGGAVFLRCSAMASRCSRPGANRFPARA